MIEQRAGVRWEGTIARGQGELQSASVAFQGLAMDVPSRMGEEGGKTTPEEMIAAAHATCFTMALGSILARERTPPESLEYETICALDETEGKRAIVSIDLHVSGKVPGVTAEAFERAAGQAEEQCVVSRALMGNVQIKSHPTLVQ